MRRLRPRLRYANVMSSIAVFIALGGGAYAAVSSIPGPDGVIHGCYQKKKGSLRLVAAGRRCARSERAIAFNQQGPAGPRGSRGSAGSKGVKGATGSQGTTGAAGAPGAPGAKGETGPRGPGASSFGGNVNAGSSATVATLANGLKVTGTCGASSVVGVELETVDASTHFQGSGTALSEGGTVMKPVALNETAKGLGSSNAAQADLEVIARNTTFPSFDRLDVHGSYGSPCVFWGMITPSG
jgi:hypothetical protein